MRMLFNKPILPLLISLCFFILSCDKNDEGTVDYPINYTSKAYTEINYRIFTQDGEITSTSEVENIINSHKELFTDLNKDEINGRIIATYLSEDFVQITIDGSSEEKLRSISATPDMVYWEAQDTTTVVGHEAYFILNNLKYPPLHFEEFHVPMSSGFVTAIKAKDCFFVIPNKKKLKLPFFDYVRKGEFSVTQTLEINNSFKKNEFNVYTGDTLLIQEYFIELE